nr:MAG TPA: hypothetical protein [Caudoviricetes sp.]
MCKNRAHRDETRGLRAWDVKTDYENRQFYILHGKLYMLFLQKAIILPNLPVIINGLRERLTMTPALI